jgi:hypothetical protein
VSAAAELDFRQIAALCNGVLSRLNAVREEEAAAWSESLRGWLVTRRQDVTDAFLGKFPLSASAWRRAVSCRRKWRILPGAIR